MTRIEIEKKFNGRRKSRNSIVNHMINRKSMRLSDKNLEYANPFFYVLYIRMILKLLLRYTNEYQKAKQDNPNLTKEQFVNEEFDEDDKNESDKQFEEEKKE